jgi:hypothetical protein
VVDNLKPQDDEDPQSDEETATKRSDLAPPPPPLDMFIQQLYLVPVNDPNKAKVVKFKDGIKSESTNNKFLPFDPVNKRYFSGWETKAQNRPFNDNKTNDVEQYYDLVTTVDRQSSKLPENAIPVNDLINRNQFLVDQESSRFDGNAKMEKKLRDMQTQYTMSGKLSLFPDNQ